MALLVTLFLVLVNIFNAITTNSPKADGLNALQVRQHLHEGLGDTFTCMKGQGREQRLTFIPVCRSKNGYSEGHQECIHMHMMPAKKQGLTPSLLSTFSDKLPYMLPPTCEDIISICPLS